LNYDYARLDDDLAGATTGNPNNPWVLGESLRDSDGNVIIPYDPNDLTPIAVQKPTLEFAKKAVDGICLQQEPGKIVTTQGNFENGDLGSQWDEGAWRDTRTQPGVPEFAGLKSWTNNIDNWAARMVLLFEPLDNMEWMFNLHGTQNRGDSAHLQMVGAVTKVNQPGFFESRQNGFSENAAAARSGFTLGEGVRDVDGVDEPRQFKGGGQGGGDPYSGFYSSDGIEYIDAWGINGRGFWDLGAVVITLLYDYEWYDREVQDEGDANPSLVFPAIWLDSAWQTTEELRIEGEGERYKWTTGFFFLHEKLNASNIFPSTQNFHITQIFDQKLTSWAPYVSGEIDLVEEGVIPGVYELTLGAGVRYNNEKKTFVLGSSAVPTQSNLVIQILQEPPAEATWKEWTGDVQLSYTPFSNEYGTLLSYLKYGHGFKGGHFNAGLTVSGGNDVSNQIGGVEPEFIDAVEFGIRSRWFDDRVILNAAVFRYWYQDLQVFDITNEAGALPIQKLLNGDANVFGAEAELRVKPVPGLLVSANMGWLDSEFGEFVVSKAVAQPRGAPIAAEFDYEGNRLVSAPEWNFSVITEYEIPLFGWGSLVPQYDFNYRSKGYLDPQMVDPISQEGYWLHNARVAYRTPDERIEVAFWVSNLFDEEYKIDVFDLSRQFNTILEVWGKPRMYGVTLSLNW
jgi:iron complex outermembrane receptor protein